MPEELRETRSKEVTINGDVAYIIREYDSPIPQGQDWVGESAIVEDDIALTNFSTITEYGAVTHYNEHYR